MWAFHIAGTFQALSLSMATTTIVTLFGQEHSVDGLFSSGRMDIRIGLSKSFRINRILENILSVSCSPTGM